MEKELGKVAKLKAEIVGGKLVLEVDHEDAVVSAGVVVKVDLMIVKEAIKKAIPGQIDDMVLDVAFELLQKV